MSPAGEAYLKWYYDSGIWRNLQYRGVRILKSVADLWNYQEIFEERRIEWVVETGTRHGGSALFFADLLAARKAPGLVISVDVTHDALQIRPSDTVRLLIGDSAAPEVISAIGSLLPENRGAMFVILDSDHSREHVLGELNAYVALMRAGDYLVVEDTCVNGHPVRPEFGPGPMEAVTAFIQAHPDVLLHDAAREEKFGYTFAPGGHFIRTSTPLNTSSESAESLVERTDPRRRGRHVDAGPLKLNLGCGDKILPGYTNVDVAPTRRGLRPDVICDLHDLAAFAENCADEILAVHVVEHFWRWEVVDVLREWLRVLKRGGMMVLECPNLSSACEEFLKDPRRFSGPGPEGQRTMWVFYGDPAWRDPLMVHRWGYTPESLAHVMQEAGLIDIRQAPAQFKLREPRDMRLVGVKP